MKHCEAAYHIIVWANTIVIGLILEGQRKKTLLLAVGLVNAGKRFGDDSTTAKETRLESSMLTRGALAVVVITNNNPWLAVIAVPGSNVWHSSPFTGLVVLNVISLIVGRVDGTNEAVLGNVFKVASVLEPWSTSGDVIGGALALYLDQDRAALRVFAVPSRERCEFLKALRLGVDEDIDAVLVSWWWLVGVNTLVIPETRQIFSSWVGEFEGLAVCANQTVCHRVEAKRAGESHGSDDVWRGNERMGGRVGVVSAGEVTVVGCDDRVGFALGDILAVPLTDARAASVGENNTSSLLEDLHNAIALNGGADLLGAGSDGEHRFDLEAVVESFLGDGCGATHVFIRRVGLNDLH